MVISAYVYALELKLGDFGVHELAHAVFIAITFGAVGEINGVYTCAARSRTSSATATFGESAVKR